MKFSTILPIVASLSTVAFADNLVTAIVSDINGNLNQYLSYIAANNIDAGPLISLYRQVQTYTDDSYTTLANPGLEASLSAFATGLPWYSERLAGDSTPASSTAPPEESSTTSSAVETTSAPAESSTHAEETSSSAPAESSTHAESSAPTVVPSEGAGNSLVIAPLGVAMAGAIALLM
ncbi:unnamed protein product [[Candida] boidinii]|uniref:Unnamed protein product n=1 Tax=Candida boidinii TaxID=5477 RepID=A0A9W6SYI2_CANBO|nr:hypothetical protein B5S30_g2302 [[Candida] boidinii]GME69882.1 unnamed protein product [[Candida] boidinii]GMF50750.1 unnamed protein product [[Candida] boidinii]GMF99168.1 unnamed protein product [[Candida] boidinii]